MRRMIVTATALLTFSGLALASALLATTPACEVFTADEVTALLQTPADVLGGTADFPHRSDCFWQTGTDGRLEVKLTGPEAFAPSKRSAAIQFDDDVKLIKDSVQLETIEGLGERAALYPSDDRPGVWFVMLVANGHYLQMTVKAGAHDRIVTAMRLAAERL